ncbi:MAG TPA: hypothetical protein PLV93_03705 [Microthrixaceae bacterium]|nr:hypothetical protein [Microthrixaceae bacterium]
MAPPTSTTTTTAPPATGGDTVSVRVGGGYSYQNSGTVGGSGYAVAADGSGINGISGFGTLPGKNGGSAWVRVNVNRFLWWSFGSIAVADPSAGINLEAPLVFAPQPYGSKTAASIGASWFNYADGFKSYTIDVTVGDKA